jgi:Family of unknown function (DUF6476)
LRALRAVVIGLGLVLVLGLGALIAVMATRLSGRGAAAPARSFGQASVALPHEAVVLSGEASGDRYVLHLGLPSGARQLVVIDLGSGAVLGRIELQPEH